MALVQKKLSRAKQLRLAAALLLVIGITLAVAYNGIIKRGGPGPEEQTGAPRPAVSAPTGVPSQTGSEAARELGSVPLFQKLRSFGQWPLSVEPKGKSQPFILKKK